MDKKQYKHRYMIFLSLVLGLGWFELYSAQAIQNTFHLSNVMVADIFAVFEGIGIAFMLFYIIKYREQD